MTVQYGQIKPTLLAIGCGDQAAMASGTQKFGRLVLIAGAAVLLLQAAACADLPATSGPKPQIKPPEAYQDQQSFAAPVTDWPTDRWWDAYGDAQLSGLIDEALKGSPAG